MNNYNIEITSNTDNLKSLKPIGNEPHVVNTKTYTISVDGYVVIQMKVDDSIDEKCVINRILLGGLWQ